MTISLTGTAAWLRAQSAEETGPAGRFLHFLLDRGAEPRLQALPAPQAEFDGVVALFGTALGQEQRVTASIGRLYAQAQGAGDYPSLLLLHRELPARRDD